jgi:hypothetical protein
MPLAGKVGAVFLQTEAEPVAFIKESAAGNLQRTVYTIENEACRYLDKNAPVVVYVNDMVVSGGFTVEHLGGVVRFLTPLLEGDTVTVSGKSVKVDQAGGFFNWSAELAADTAEVTTFASDGWKEYLPAVKGFAASAESYWADGRLSERLGREIIVALYLDAGPGKKRYEGYAVIASDSIELAADDVVNEGIEFEGSGNLYYRED